MGIFLSKAELSRTEPADVAAFRSPVPTQIVSNGEFNPLPQTDRQREVEARLKAVADANGRRLGMDRRGFLHSACGMAAAFLAMNKVYGPLFSVSEAEAAEPDAAKARAGALAAQFIFDDQLHFVRDDFRQDGILDLAKYASEHWNPGMLKDAGMSLARYKFENFVKEVYVDSDTKVGLLSSAPFDDPSWWFLSNDQMARARQVMNTVSGSRRMLCHSLFTPGQPGWLDEVDRCIAEVRPDSWKGYTIGDPLNPSKFPWRLDDEQLVYPFYDRIAKAGITTVCIHKGLLPVDYEKKFPGVWKHATVDDLAKAAKDWPQINFVIYHAGLRAFLEPPEADLAEFERTGYIRWASDLARIPQEHGVSNVYAEIGTAFANSAVANPRFCAAFMGTLIKGMGADHVVWGTDSVWYGSPQWQIEALRRLEIPADMQAKHGFAPLGPADGAVKSTIFGFTSARLYRVDLRATLDAIDGDQMSAIKAAYADAPGGGSNAAYGYVAKRA
jgi:predicted TIM-barrel fold metal-dependent hydrolase